MFLYLWREGRLQTSYEVTESYHMGDIGKEPSATDVRELRSCGIKGSVKDSKTYTTDHFGIKDAFDDLDKPIFMSIVFDTVPGRRLGEYQDDTRLLWEKTKKLVGKYFTEGPGRADSP